MIIKLSQVENPLDEWAKTENPKTDVILFYAPNLNKVQFPGGFSSNSFNGKFFGFSRRGANIIIKIIKTIMPKSEINLSSFDKIKGLQF